MPDTPTAALLIIGNEILSGRTQDKNMSWLGQQLGELGIPMREVRVVADVEGDIIAAVNDLRARYTYLFTTGGIGPTHDDITSECLANALGRPFERNKEAKAILETHYGDQINEARLSMADMPQGVTLIANPVSLAPGFQIENVYVLAGVPRIMQAMFDGLRGGLKGGAPVRSRTYSVYVTEGNLADGLTRIQDAHPTVEIGSYPFIRDGRLGTSLVVRASDEIALRSAANELHAFLRRVADDVHEE